MAYPAFGPHTAYTPTTAVYATYAAIGQDVYWYLRELRRVAEEIQTHRLRRRRRARRVARGAAAQRRGRGHLIRARSGVGVVDIDGEIDVAVVRVPARAPPRASPPPPPPPPPAWVKRSVSRTSYRSNVEREARVKSDDGKSP